MNSLEMRFIKLVFPDDLAPKNPETWYEQIGMPVGPPDNIYTLFSFIIYV